MKFANLFYIFAVTAVMSTSGCSNKKDFRTIEGVIWNTTYHITYRCPDDMSDSITEVMRQVEMSLSPFQRNSLISLINRNENDSVDSMIATVFTASKKIHSISGGSFDPTVSPLVNLWGFGYDNASGEPTTSQIDSCLQLVGISGCDIRSGRMIKKSSGTQFNFSAITKGFGCDQVGLVLKKAGCDNFMVEIGGELTLSGSNPRGGKWRVMIDTPSDINSDGIRNGIAVIEVSDCGIATSGNYRNYRESKNGRIGHTISPKTGKPVQTEILSATVIAPDAMTADALATASMTMTLAEAVNMIGSLGKDYSALFISNRNGEWSLHTAGKFPDIIK